MGWPRTLALVRHAQSEGNVLGVDQRAEFDVATHRYHVTQRGHAQGTITGNYLKERFGTFDIRYASYYTRSQETMADMYPGL